MKSILRDIGFALLTLCFCLLTFLVNGGCGLRNVEAIKADPKLYPCGGQAHECRNGMCCGAYFTCGGDDPACPSGFCCYIGVQYEPGGFSRDPGSVR